MKRLRYAMIAAALALVTTTLFSEIDPKKVCLAPDLVEGGRVLKARLSGNKFDFCIGLYGEEKLRCYSWDQKQFRFADEAGIPSAFPDRFLSLKSDGQSLSLCSPKCQNIKLDPRLKLKPDSVVRASLSGRTIFALVEITRPNPDERHKATFASIGRDGKIAGTFQVDIEDPQATYWDFLDETLHVRVCVGAGPGCGSQLYDRTGRRIGVVGKGPKHEHQLNTFDGAEAQYKGDLWLFLGAGSERLVIQDVKTGRIDKSIALPANDVSFGGYLATDGRGVWIFPSSSAIGRILKVDIAKGTFAKVGQLPLCPESPDR